MNAKYAGTCAATGRPFNAGDLIDYNKAKKTRGPGSRKQGHRHYII
jgi:hypothetical protein